MHISFEKLVRNNFRCGRMLFSQAKRDAGASGLFVLHRIEVTYD